MGFKLDDIELRDFSGNLDKYCEARIAVLENIKNGINTFVKTDSVFGKTAESIFSYMSDVHISLIDNIITYLCEYQKKVQGFVAHTENLDKRTNAIIDTDVLGLCVADFSRLNSSFNSSYEKLISVFEQINYIKNMSDVYSSYGGNDKYDAMVSTFRYAASTVDFLKVAIEDHNMREVSSGVSDLREYGENLLLSICSFKDKEESQIKEFTVEELSNNYFYEKMQDSYENSKEYLERVSDADYSDVIDDATNEFIGKEIELVENAIQNNLDGTFNALEGALTIEAGVSTLGASKVAGVIIIIYGVGQVALSVADIWYGTVQYTKAFVTGDVYYEHTTLKDQFVDAVYGGDAENAKLNNTVVSTCLSATEKYVKKGNPWTAVGYTVLEYGYSDVLIPLVAENTDEMLDATEVNYTDSEKSIVRMAIEQCLKKAPTMILESAGEFFD